MNNSLFRSLCLCVAVLTVTLRSVWAADRSNTSKTKLPKDAELHVVSVYEGQRSPEYRIALAKILNLSATELEKLDWAKTMENISRRYPSTVTVNITKTNAPIALVLNAYDHTIWRLHLNKNVNIKKILISSYNKNSIRGVPRKVAVINKFNPSNLNLSLYTDDNEPVFSSVYNEANKKRECSDQVNPLYSDNFLSSLHTLNASFGIAPSSIQGEYSKATFTIDNATTGISVTKERQSGLCYMDSDGVIREHQ